VSAPTAETGPRDHLPTEQRNPRSMRLDELAAREAVELFCAEDRAVPEAVAAAAAEIARAVELVAERLSGGGRLFYVGAGTSGRLGALDAAECPPTFQSDPAHVQAILAGGPEALVRSVEGAEDSAEGAVRAVHERGVGPRDALFGISAGGTTPFVHAALERGRQLGAATIFLSCVPRELVPDRADVSIRVLTGPEVLTGSTRLKAGTATKLVLNIVSTLAMARLGKVHENLMVDLDAGANRKLGSRAVSILALLTGLERRAAGLLLDRAGGRVKVAAVMHARGLGRAEAEARLAAAGGVLRRALD
jgi:N-acetylmuramic acid 6-phosphate etherase